MRRMSPPSPRAASTDAAGLPASAGAATDPGAPGGSGSVALSPALAASGTPAQPAQVDRNADAPGWDELRAVQAVLAHGSLSGAARALASSQPTLGRHIAALEQRWGVALFIRSKTGLKPTEAALALAPLADAMAAQALAMGRVAEGWRSAQLHATVRLTASDMMGHAVLPPLLARLQDEHPGIRIELSLSNRVQDLIGREVDVAVRMHQPHQPALLAQRVADRPVGLFAHRRYLAAHGVPHTEADLLEHRLIGHDREGPPALAPEHAAIWQRARFALRCADEAAQWALVRAGAGIGAGHVALAAAQPDLQRVLPQVELSLPVWLCMHEDLRHSAAHLAVFRALADGLRAPPPA